MNEVFSPTGLASQVLFGLKTAETSAGQNTASALLEFSMRSAIHGTSCVWSVYLFAMIDKLSPQFHDMER